MVASLVFQRLKRRHSTFPPCAPPCNERLGVANPARLPQRNRQSSLLHADKRVRNARARIATYSKLPISFSTSSRISPDLTSDFI